uniref:Uncharacterized protein n=1 Tax=Thermocrinis ruber TaxID=75906 RepID=A0A7C5X3D3_9AQUI
MREDLEYCKSGQFRLKLEDLCYAWAVLEEEEKGNLGEVIRVRKVGRVLKRERYAVLYTRWLISHLLSGTVSPKRYRYYTALILVKKLKLLSCKKLFLILEKNSNRLSKSNIPRLKELAKKYLDKKLLERIEMETIKLVEEILKAKQQEPPT